MRKTVLCSTLVMALAAHGCGSSGSCKTGCADGGSEAGGGTAGTGGAGGAVGGRGGTDVGGRGGTGATGGQAGGAFGGTAGSEACSEPASCEGYDNGPDANLTAAITCLSPSSTAANTGFALAIFGHHLATGAGANAIVVIGNGSPLNGVPASACRLDVSVPASTIGSPGQFPVVVSPGGRIQESSPATLTVQ
jgi:hypothetical protein